MSDHGHSHDHGHGHHGAAEAHGSLKDYVIGFVLSVILTAIPFWLVMTHALPNGTTAAVILGLGAVQMVVHIIYFLHMSGKAEGGWSMTAMIFTIIVVVIMLSGSIWVMYHLNANMMPMPADMRQMP
jgi:cytochrome o ubiquinol oxidase operon protein cyoD